MKTLQELYDEIIVSEELKTEFYESAKTKEDAEAFLRKYGCAASVDELKEFLNEKVYAESKSMSEEELKQVAGGGEKTSKIVSNIVVTLLAFGGCVTQSFYEGSLNSKDCFLS